MAAILLHDVLQEVGIPSSRLDHRVSDDHLRSVSLFLTSWRTLAPFLGLNDADIEVVEEEGKGEENKRLKVLQRWNNKMAFKATYRKLVEALLSLGMASLAVEVCRLLQPERQPSESGKLRSSSPPSGATAVEPSTSKELFSLGVKPKDYELQNVGGVHLHKRIAHELQGNRSPRKYEELKSDPQTPDRHEFKADPRPLSHRCKPLKILLIVVMLGTVTVMIVYGVPSELVEYINLVKAVVNILPNAYVKTGVYEILDPCKSRFSKGNQARCDMDTDNGGWLVIQRRVKNGTVDFYRDWIDYEEGFGDLEGEFWYGLRNIHCLTNNASVELRMDMEDESGNKITWTYQEFRVEGPENKYRLHIGGGEGTPGTTDHMHKTRETRRNVNNMYFSTRDRDNDLATGGCAGPQALKGAWWHNRCANTNPNGAHEYRAATYQRVSSVTTGSWVYYPNYEIKIRPKSCALFQTSDTCVYMICGCMYCHEH